MKLASHVLAKQAMTQDIDDLRAMFEVLDTDRTGTISFEQFRTVLFPPEDMGEEETPYTDAYIEELFHKLVRDHDTTCEIWQCREAPQFLTFQFFLSLRWFVGCQ